MADENRNTATLILVPTESELDILKKIPEYKPMVQSTRVCGFGPIVSAARTSQLIGRYAPQNVMLIGIAGAYSSELKIGTASAFGSVACFGIGVGSGSQFQTASQAGWQQWNDVENEIGETIELSNSGNFTKQLLTCTSSSADLADVEQRLQHFPNATAEDMEGFAVAAACRLADVSLSIVRGISNFAGNRDKSNWQIESALQSALELAIELIGDGE